MSYVQIGIGLAAMCFLAFLVWRTERSAKRIGRLEEQVLTKEHAVDVLQKRNEIANGPATPPDGVTDWVRDIEQ